MNLNSDNYTYDSNNHLYILDSPFITRKNRSLNFPFGFKPTFHRYRLDLMGSVKNGNKVLVGSMADCFGDWIPDDWLVQIFNSCIKYDHHNYLFLTKNPARYYDLDKNGLLPKRNNFWYGTSVIYPDDSYFSDSDYNTYICFEPIKQEWGAADVSKIAINANWIIIGAETGSHTNKTIASNDCFDVFVNVSSQLNVPLYINGDTTTLASGRYLIKNVPENLQATKSVSEQKSSSWYKKMICDCAMCNKAFYKKEMISLLAREKRAASAKSIAHLCKKCYTRFCEETLRR